MEDCAATRRAGLSYSTSFDMGAEPAVGKGSGSSRRRAVVGCCIAGAALLCVAAAGSDALASREGRAASGATSALLSRPSPSEMNSVAWRTLHNQFQREDAELQAQLGIARLPSLRHIDAGLSGEEMSSALGDSSDMGLSAHSLSKGAAKLRILKRYGEKGESMDNDMGFAGDAGPYSALLQTSAVVGDPSEPSTARTLPMLWETGGGGGTEYADAMSANGLPANDARWPESAATSAAQSLRQEAAKAAQALISSEKKARAEAEEERRQQQQRFLQEQAHEAKLKVAKTAAEQAMKKNAVMQEEQERQDAEADGHVLSKTGSSEYDAHYQTLLATAEGVNGHWQDPALPGEDMAPRRQRLAFNDAIQHWADAENREGISPNEPRSSSTPPGTSTLRVAPLRAALQERMREEAARSGAELGREQRVQAVQKRLAEDYTGNVQQLSMGIGGIGPGEEEGNDKDWRVAMEVDRNCQDTLNDMAAGSLGALMHGSDDCGPNRKKLPVFWPYARVPGQNWQPGEPAKPGSDAAAAAALNRQQQLVQTSKSEPVWDGDNAYSVSGTEPSGQGSQIARTQPRPRAPRPKMADGKVVKMLERDVRQATASERQAVGKESDLRQQDKLARADAVAAERGEKALEERVRRLDERSRVEAKEMVHAKAGEAAKEAQQQALVKSLSTQLAGASREVSIT